MDWLNYHHLHYFWVVAREGSIVRACEILHLSQPTISTQLQQLEQSLGGKLFERAGRGLRLTELGQTVFTYADEIFALGKQLIDAAKGRPTGQPLKLIVGISEVLAKLVVYRLLLPALHMPEQVSLVCHEGSEVELLASLAAYELDLVISDAPLASGSRVKAFSHLLGECGTTIFGKPALRKRYYQNFPQSLDGAPMLLPASPTNARRSLEMWFDDQKIQPQIAGEFDDSALMKVFGQEGIGMFPAPSVIETEICAQYGVQVVGRIDQVRERFYAISVERKLKNPAAVEISRAARSQVFAPKQDEAT